VFIHRDDKGTVTTSHPHEPYGDTSGISTDRFRPISVISVADCLLFSGVMRVRITRAPRGVVDGMSLHYYHTGEAYEVSSDLAEYLVAAGFASIEMRQRQRSSRPRTHDRRRSRAARV
jgi:hypothetical protein